MGILISPLQLEGYYVREFEFAARPDVVGTTPLALQFGLHPQLQATFDPGDLTIGLQAGIADNDKEPNRIMALLEVRSATEPEIKIPYDFRVVMVGFFVLNTQVPAEQRELAMGALRQTAVSLLYSAAREFIAGVTARGPFPAIVLPTAVITPDDPQAQEQPSAAKKAGRRSATKKAAKKAAKKGRGKKQQR